MIVDQPHCLHEGIDGGRADESPAALFEITRQSYRRRCGRHAMQYLMSDAPWTAARIGLEGPDKGRQGTEFAAQFKHAPGIVDGGDDLAAMTHDAGIANQPLDVVLVESDDA